MHAKYMGTYVQGSFTLMKNSQEIKANAVLATSKINLHLSHPHLKNKMCKGPLILI